MQKLSPQLIVVKEKKEDRPVGTAVSDHPDLVHIVNTSSRKRRRRA